MFSAVKFMVAGVIVALSGGFLLAGVLTTQRGEDTIPAAVTASPTTEATTGPSESTPPPVTTEGLLAGLVAREVEPGVFRVDDGVSRPTWEVFVGYDGSVWLFSQDQTSDEYYDHTDRFLRLGSDEAHQWPLSGYVDGVLEVAPDGTMWVIGNDEGRHSIDGEDWTVQTCPQGRHCRGFTLAPDGTVWASWREEDGRWRVGHLGATGWQPLDGYARARTGFPGYSRLFVTDAGDIYGEWTKYEGLFHYEDGTWEHFSQPAYDLIDVGRDGTVWQYAGDGLYRFTDGEWSHWTADDLPAIRPGLTTFNGEDDVHEFKVAPDGSLWFSLKQSTGACDGLARFDGETLDQYLPGRCIDGLDSMDIAPDGSVWLRTDGADSNGLYVITPEAVAAST